MESLFSIICAYNNKKILERYLLKSLESQSSKYELILFDNSSGRFKSSAQLMNRLSNKANGKYLMFVHQDIMFAFNSFLEDTEQIIEKIPNLGIVGAAGKNDEFPNTLTNILQGNPPALAGTPIKTITKVQTLDSCLAIIPKVVYKHLQFDEKVIRGWHFFIVDYCLSVKYLGYDVYVIPMDFYHKSFPKYVQLSYLVGLLRILLKHKQNKMIYTTVGNWNLRGYFLDVLRAVYYKEILGKRSKGN